jgi:hypothetical protein
MNRTLIALLFAFVIVDQARAQTAQVAPAADITNTEIQAAVQKSVSQPVSDQPLRMVTINGEYNVGAAVVTRATPHTFTEITTDRIVYMVVRVDPHKVLQAD